MTMSAGASSSGCDAGDWLADPGISPTVLEANGYRVVTRQTLSLDNGRQAIETVMAAGARTARCRVEYDERGTAVGTTCYLPCRRG